MAQIFHRSTNHISKASIIGGAMAAGLAVTVLISLGFSPYSTRQNVVRDQPVKFSHRHHVSGLGIDCRHCHTSVEISSSAGIPPTKTCYNCHSQIWSDAPLLEPVRESFRSDQSIEWTRVHDLPDYVYFNHSIHVSKGVGCSTCHGRVDLMPLVWKHAPLTMSWCLDCHRNPAQYLRPREEVFNMAWQPPSNQMDLGKDLMDEYGVRRALDCSACHR